MKIIGPFLCILLLALPATAQKVYNINKDGNIIHLKTFGEGRALLIINGGPGMHSAGFIPLARTLGKTHRTIIYDQRGTGHSKIPRIGAQSITLDKMLDDIEVIREHLRIKQWVVMGHSFGGMLASYYATKFPDRIRGLILSSSGGIDMELFATLNIPARLTQDQRDSLSYWRARTNQGDTTYYARFQRGKYLAPAYLYDKTHVNTIAHRLTEGNMHINQLVYQDMRRMQFDCAKALQSFRKPVLIIQGEQDIIPRAIGLKAHRTFPQSTFVTIENCGHYGWLEQPRVYYEKITSFLNAL